MRWLKALGPSGRLILAVLLAGLLVSAELIAIAAYRYRVSAPVTGEVVADAQPGLSLDKPSYTFDGLVRGERSAVRTAVVTNIGDRPLTRLIPEMQGLPAGITFLSSYLPAPGTAVPPGGSWQLFIQLDVATTTAVGPFTATLAPWAE